MSTAKLVRDLLKRRGEEELLLDVVRALAAFHGVLWESEFTIDIAKVRGFSLSYIPTRRDISKAIDRLAEMGLVTVEERPRGSMFSPKTYTDRLVRLKDFPLVRSILFSEDPIFREFMIRKFESLRRVSSQE